jgi:hypothetical protein
MVSILPVVTASLFVCLIHFSLLFLACLLGGISMVELYLIDGRDNG